jgi:hypothetical protein
MPANGRLDLTRHLEGYCEKPMSYKIREMIAVFFYFNLQIFERNEAEKMS